MHIHLIAIGKHMPEWVDTGYREYAKRLTQEYRLQLSEIYAGKRTKSSDIARLIRLEGEQMLACMDSKSLVIALDVTGQSWDTPTLAGKLENWHTAGRSLSLLVGGPEGLAPSCLARAELRWSLSPLTLPHPLVRILLAEQLYRAVSLIKHHPYHRA